MLTNDNRCVRYWGISGCVVLGKQALPAADALEKCLNDPEPINQLRAARALAGMERPKQAIPVIRRFALGESNELALQAVLAIDECELLTLETGLRETLKRVRGQYAKRVVAKLLDE